MSARDPRAERPSDDSRSLRSQARTEAAGVPVPGARIGPYRIVEKLGAGGMGEVYRALQEEPRREVALKVIKLGMDTRSVIARFENERQALAVMSHPGIAGVYDAGITERGRPYFVMELVRGLPINEYCDRHNLTTEERLTLFIAVCDAVQHAHQKGVIHRDLKPSNILVAVQDERPQAKIIDFGVAKATGHRLTEGTLYTRAGELVGTPEYMSPEQAELTGLDVDTRADIYSLGVVLYELLTGSLPFDTATLRSGSVLDLQRILREEEPARPSARLAQLGERCESVARHHQADPRALIHDVRGDLDWIAMKALDKDRTRRYETANALAYDIRRHLAHEPVRARPPSNVYRVRKFVRRNRLAVGFVVSLFLALVGGIAGTGIGIVRARSAASKANAGFEFLQHILWAADPRLAQGREVTVRDVLAGAAERADAIERPEVEALVRLTIGRTYTRLGHLDEAAPHLARAHALYEELLGERDESTVAAGNQLAVLRFKQQRYEDARDLWAAQLEAALERHGRAHPPTLTLMQNLAAAHLALEDYARAEPLLREALRGRRRVLGEDDRQTTATRINLAHLYRETGRLDEAEPLFVELLETCRRTLKPMDPLTVRSTFNLGDLYARIGRFDEAEPLVSGALDGLRTLFGNEHADTLEAVVRLAQIRLERGRPADAEALALEGYEGLRALRGPDHADTLAASEIVDRIRQTPEKGDRSIIPTPENADRTQ